MDLLRGIALAFLLVVYVVAFNIGRLLSKIKGYGNF